MAYNNGGIYHQLPNGYTIMPNFNNHQPTQQRPNNVRKVGKHEDEEAGKLFVGGLSWDTTQESLLAYFSRYGDVIDCVVMKNSNTNRSRGFGFVTFADPCKIEAVLANCPHSLDGRTIDPKACNPRSMQKPKKSNGYPKVFLGGLPSTITETDLRNFFSKYGEVCEVVIMYDQEKKKSRGFGFLSFETEVARERAVADHFVMIQNKQVEIKRAEPRTFHINGNSIKEQATQQQQIPEQWATVQQNGAGPHIIGPAPQNNWSSSYPIWNQPPPSTPPAPQWTAYASPPPPPVSSVAPPFYPAPAVTPTNFWAMQGQTQSSTEQQFSQKISFYGAPPTGPAAPPPPPTYPTQYPKAAQYPNEYFTALSAGGVTNTAPMVAYTTPSLGGRGPAAAATPGTLFTTQQQVTSSQSYHPYRRQP